jgi:polyhydroxyalkanoate synthesis repressor PhaR
VRPPAITIKKYPNRRLYDTSVGRYVNLEDVAALIRQGADVQVVDARSGEDLTRLVLTQIIVEGVKGQPAGLSLDVLRNLVMATEGALSDVRSAALSPFQMMKKLLTPEPAPETESEVEELRRRVAELELQTAKRARPARRGAAPRKPRGPKPAAP